MDAFIAIRDKYRENAGFSEAATMGSSLDEAGVPIEIRLTKPMR